MHGVRPGGEVGTLPVVFGKKALVERSTIKIRIRPERRADFGLLEDRSSKDSGQEPWAEAAQVFRGTPDQIVGVVGDASLVADQLRAGREPKQRVFAIGQPVIDVGGPVAERRCPTIGELGEENRTCDLEDAVPPRNARSSDASMSILMRSGGRRPGSAASASSVVCATAIVRTLPGGAPTCTPLYAPCSQD